MCITEVIQCISIPILSTTLGRRVVVRTPHNALFANGLEDGDVSGMKSSRLNVSSGTRWEPVVGYSRAVRVGNVVHVAGTTATDAAGQVVGGGDPHAQAGQTLRNIQRALGQAGATLKKAVRTRVYLTHSARWQGVARAHRPGCAAIRTACTL